MWGIYFILPTAPQVRSQSLRTYAKGRGEGCAFLTNTSFHHRRKNGLLEGLRPAKSPACPSPITMTFGCTGLCHSFGAIAAQTSFWHLSPGRLRRRFTVGSGEARCPLGASPNHYLW